MNTFKADLERGKIGEFLVMKTFKSLGFEVKDTSKDELFFKDDVDFITADGIKYEIKTDFRVQETGNLALESYVDYGFGREKSWLWKSDTDFFIFVNPYDTSHFYYIAANDLRHLVRTETFRTVVKSDGYKDIHLVLFPLGDYESCFDVIDTEVEIEL